MPELHDLLDGVELFFGDANHAVARVYARLRNAPAGAGLRLSGTIQGPRCVYARTLPATVPFRESSAGESLLAEAIVPDPCFWSIDLPFLYDVELALTDTKGDTHALTRTFGLRRFSRRDCRFVFDGQPWVLRAARVRSAQADSLSKWREERMALVLDACDDALAQAASEVGVPLFVQPNLSGDGLVEEIARLARWPAVAGIILPGPRGNETAACRAAAPNLTVGWQASAGHAAPASAEFVVESADATKDVLTARLNDTLPLVVMRNEESDPTPEAARAACDRLQRDFAPIGQAAGYIV